MSLVTYEDVRPWARAIKQRTAIGPHAGVMPPWYIEKNIGIQHYKNDPSLERPRDRDDREVGRQRRAAWATPPTCRRRVSSTTPTAWTIGTPDLVVSTKEIVVKANAPDWWGEIESVPIRARRGSLRRGASDSRSERRAEATAAAAPRSAAATCSTT